MVLNRGNLEEGRMKYLITLAVVPILILLTMMTIERRMVLRIAKRQLPR